MSGKFVPLFEPIRIGPKTMRNRFYKTPHGSGFTNDRPGAEAAFRAMAAEGGWGAVNTGSCSIHRSTDEAPLPSARIWDDGDAASLQLMVRAAQRFGALVGVELDHGGGHMSNYESRIPQGGVSQINSEINIFQNCFEYDKAGIREVQKQYAQAAKRAADIGFDLINVYGGHGHSLPHQFLDPFYNRRTDEYGGSFENRARFWIETIERVRDAVGDRCAVVARIGLDNLYPGRLTLDDALRFISAADHLIDLWDLQVGSAKDGRMTSRFASQNSELPWIKRVRAHSSKPLVGVGRFTDPDMMLSMIESGALDIIGSARGSIADPFLPTKIKEQRFQDIRECIGCNMCASRFVRAQPLICTQNPTIGEEYRRGWHPEKFSPAKNRENDVLVVGAGPAGLECAHILAKRGFRSVYVVDGEKEIGGHVKWTASLPGLAEWRRVVAYRESQLAQLDNVEIVTGMRLSADEILDYGASIVVLATGSRWAGNGLNAVTREPIPGASGDLPHVLTPEQVAAGKPAPAGKVVIYDTDGYHLAYSIAEKYVGLGRSVVLVTPFKEVSPFSVFTGETDRLNRRIREIGVDVRTDTILSRIDAGMVEVCDKWGVRPPEKVEAGAVVLITQRLSDDAIYRELRARGDELAANEISAIYQIGDCVVPRPIADSVFDGHRLAREIDEATPEEHALFIRERTVVGAREMSWLEGLGKGSGR